MKYKDIHDFDDNLQSLILKRKARVWLWCHHHASLWCHHATLRGHHAALWLWGHHASLWGHHGLVSAHLHWLSHLNIHIGSWNHTTIWRHHHTISRHHLTAVLLVHLKISIGSPSFLRFLLLIVKVVAPES